MYIKKKSAPFNQGSNSSEKEKLRRNYQALASLTLIYPSLAASEDEMMKLLMPAGRGRIALRAALVPATAGSAAVANRLSARDDTVLASASSAGVACWRKTLAVRNLPSLVPAT